VTPGPGAAALVTSALGVVGVAAAFDVLAGERPHHTLSLVIVAATVGLLRWAAHGRLRGLFFLVNVALVAQPVAHGMSKVTQATAGMLPHSHDIPHDLHGIALQLAVALLVVVVAGSEPIVAFVASTVLTVAAAVSRLPVPGAADPAEVPADTDGRRIPSEGVGRTRCRPRRGPPVGAGLAAA
jgi:hypothetical protein